MTGESIKKKLLATTLLVSLSGGIWAGAAVAQESDDPVVIEAEDDEDDDDAAVQERVVVTGSRLRRNEFTSISPVQTISGEVSRDLGIVDADDVLRQTSVIQGQQTTIGLSTNLATGQAFTTFGSVTPQLRGLSSSVTGRTRNLFLINGRRLGPIGVGGAPANPDVTLIPGTLIRNVEILLDGASSVYGSDAIAGAVNYELQTDFEGFEVDAFYTTPQIGDGDQFIFSAKFGVSNDNGFIVAAGEYNQTNSLTREDRFPEFVPAATGEFGPIVCNPELEIDTQTGTVFNTCDVNPLAGFFFFSPQGTIVPTPGTTNFDVPNFSVLGVAPFDGPNSEGGFGGALNPFTRGFPEDQGATITPETSRFSIYTIGEYNIDALPTAPTAYFELSYAERDLNSTAFVQEVIQIDENTVFNPGIEESIIVSLRQTEVDQSVDLFRATVGFKGDLEFLEDFGLNNWSYDTYGLYHRSDGTQNTFGGIDQITLQRILQGETDPDTGVFTCALQESGQESNIGFTTPIPDCFAVNLFDAEFLNTGRFSDPAANDLLLTNAIATTRVEQITWNGFVTGDLFTLPTANAPIGVVLGSEFRRDVILTVNDQNLSTPNSVAGINPDIGSTGSRNIIEGFYELSVPVVADKPFIKDFTVETTGRFTEDEFAGGQFTWQAKASYRPTDWLQFSGGFGTSFRAPDTGESFGTGTVFAVNTRIDPCLPLVAALVTSNGAEVGALTADGLPGNVPVGAGIPDGIVFFDASLDERQDVIVDACTQLGVVLPSGPLDAQAATDLGLFGVGTETAAFQNFAVLMGNAGNQQVDPEDSEAFFARAVFEQPWLDQFDFRLSATYFDYLVEGSIGQLTAGTILAACFNDGSGGATPPQVVNGVVVGDLCDFQTRDPNTGLLTAVNESSFNLGSLTSRGIDFNAEFRADLDFLNSVPVFDRLERPLSFSAVYRSTFQLENDEDITGDGIFIENLGDFGFPEYQHNLTGTLSYDRFSFNYRWFFSKAQGDVAPFGGGNICSPTLIAQGVDPVEAAARCTEFIDLPAVTLHDITLSYRGDDWAIRGGVRNVADTVIVRDAGGTPADGGSGTPFGLGFDLDGRNFFINVTKQF